MFHKKLFIPLLILSVVPSTTTIAVEGTSNLRVDSIQVTPGNPFLNQNVTIAVIVIQ